MKGRNRLRCSGCLQAPCTHLQAPAPGHHSQPLLPQAHLQVLGFQGAVVLRDQT